MPAEVAVEQRLGFIGCGQLGRALLAGWLEAGVVDRAGVCIAARASAAETAAAFGVRAVSSAEVVAESAVVVVAVKPAQVGAALAGLSFHAHQLVISVAAGVNTAALAAACGPAEVVRAMPNVACRVGQGATLLFGQGASVERARVLFEAVGHVEVLEKEALFHVGTALVGSGPGFVALVIEALADGAVAAGLPRAQALRLAARVVAGTGTLAAREGIHPALLKDAVASPGGTTMQGLRALERGGLRTALLEAVLAATARSVELEGA